MARGKGQAMRKRGQLTDEELRGIFKRVIKPARYLGGEWNEVRKDPNQVKVKIVLAFPDVYEVGMSSLGLRILYNQLNRQPDILAERVFAPWPDFERSLREKNLPLFSLENKKPLAEFDIIGFSLLYELNYTNILTILDLAGLPLLSRERKNWHPLVIAGGPVCFNPEPLTDFIDAFFLGDGEEAILEIVQAYQTSREKGESRIELLRSLSRIKGMYVPIFYQAKKQSISPLVYVEPLDHVPFPLEKRVIFNLEKAPFPAKTLVPSTEIIFDRVQVEIARGCPQSCRFCQATSLYFPHRFRRPETIKKLIRENLSSSGYDEVALTALSASDYPQLASLVSDLMTELRPERIAVSFPSLRPGGVSEEVVDSIVKVRKTGLTIVPEAGTERLRRVINKHLTDNDIWEASRAAFSRGWRLLKLYFMVGLPTEREEDLLGIVRIVEEILKIGVRYLHTAPQINMSISSFIPKPHTPFQWVAMDSPASLNSKINFLKSRLKKYRSVRFKDHPVPNSVLEAVFSRGDRRLGPVILSAWQKGARFDSWSETFNFETWQEAFDEVGLDYHEYLQEIPTEARLPWEHLKTGLKRIALLRELRRAYQAEWTPTCPERSCRFCQGCDYPGEVNKINQLAQRMREKSERGRLKDQRKEVAREVGSAEGKKEAEPSQEKSPSMADHSHKKSASMAEEIKKEKEEWQEEVKARRNEGRETQKEEGKPEKEKAKSSLSIRYRLYFAKQGPACFISHLDLINTIQRILRRSGIPAEFTQGFHPKMKLTFLPALPLGMRSREEILELVVEKDIAPEIFLERLNQVSPAGLYFHRLEKIEPSRPSLNREVKAVLYSLDLTPLIEHLKKQKSGIVEQVSQSLAVATVARRIKELIEEKPDKYSKQILVNLDEVKIYLLYPVNQGQMGNPARLLQEIFNWDEAVFYLVREKVFYDETEAKQFILPLNPSGQSS